MPLFEIKTTSKRRYLHYLQLLAVMFFLHACLSPSKIYYVHDAVPEVNTISSEQKKNQIQKIGKGDRLQIIISCSDPSKTTFLNPFSNQNPGNNSSQNSVGYLVDSLGNIDFPLVGVTNVLGLSSTEAANKLKDSLKKYFIEPYVYVMLSGKVYVLNGRGGYTIPLNNERLTIFEALAEHSSYEPDDKWGEVMIVREVDGKRITSFVDLNSKEIFNSEFYYLKNNDLVYVKPGKFSTSIKATTSVRSTIGLAISIISLLILILKK